MAEPIAVEFDLDPISLVDLMERKNEKVGHVALVAVYVLLGIGMVALHNVPLAIVMFFLAAIFTAAIVRLPKVRQTMATRLAGPTKVVLADWGMEFSGANVAERMPWGRFRRVSDRPDVWVFQTKQPVAVFMVPKSAVPHEHREQFTTRLLDWSGAAYKFRKR